MSACLDCGGHGGCFPHCTRDPDEWCSGCSQKHSKCECGPSCRCATLRPGDDCPAHPFDPTQYLPVTADDLRPAGERELLHRGDQPEHRCDLPPVPQYEHPPTRTDGFHSVDALNAVAACAICGRRYVSREDTEAWGFHARWVPLRWWHRRARRNLRAAALRAAPGEATS